MRLGHALKMFSTLGFLISLVAIWIFGGFPCGFPPLHLLEDFAGLWDFLFGLSSSVFLHWAMCSCLSSQVELHHDHPRPPSHGRTLLLCHRRQNDRFWGLPWIPTDVSLGSGWLTSTPVGWDGLGVVHEEFSPGFWGLPSALAHPPHLAANPKPPACKNPNSAIKPSPEPEFHVPGYILSPCCLIPAGATTCGCWIWSSGLGPSPASRGPALTRAGASPR